MVLKYNAAWRFSPPQDGAFLNNSIPYEALEEFMALISRVATQGGRKGVLEHFKGHFSAAAGQSHVKSSNESWAESDLTSLMRNASENSPLFIEAMFDACESLHSRCPDWFVPDQSMINTVLSKHKIGYEIQSSNLLLRGSLATTVPVDEPSATLAEKASEVFQASLARSDELLSENHSREAVQEILWLLETVTTAFRGIETETGTIEGKYFNQIVRELKAKSSGSTLERALDWMLSVHGYLSSPSGGGVRHGLDLNSGVQINTNEARLFINLIRSYLSFLLVEHERLAKSGR